MLTRAFFRGCQRNDQSFVNRVSAAHRRAGEAIALYLECAARRQTREGHPCKKPCSAHVGFALERHEGCPATIQDNLRRHLWVRSSTLEHRIVECQAP